MCISSFGRDVNLFCSTLLADERQCNKSSYSKSGFVYLRYLLTGLLYSKKV